MKVSLIGFMGAGKSTVARELSTLLQCPAIELDTQIVQRSKRASIPAIFLEDGEAHFRDLEAEVARSWQGEHRAVLSTGGGIVERPENMEALQSGRGVVVFLRATFPTLQERVSGDSNRPLFAEVERARKLYESRQPLYESYADLTVDVDALSPTEIAGWIVRSLPVSQPVKDAQTQLCVIFGDPVGHSLSPAMHNAGYKALGIDGQFVFVACRVPAHQLEQAIAGARAMNLRGITCTIPHKSSVIPLLDEVDPVAERMGAVNTVVCEDGALKGYNTDWLGIVNPIEQRCGLDAKRVAVIGAGGAARAAAFGVKERGASVLVFNRSVNKAKQLADEVGGEGFGLEHIAKVEACDMIIQTTSVGMRPNVTDTLIPASLLRAEHLVMDAVYTPRYTQLLQDAKKAGATVIPGAEMFLHQGLAQFQLYTKRHAPTSVMQAVVDHALGDS